jgi:hypothetical protein
LHSAVSQICNLRRIATGQRLGPIRDSAEYNSATRQIENLRYEARYRPKQIPAILPAAADAMLPSGMATLNVEVTTKPARQSEGQDARFYRRPEARRD